MLNLQIEKEVEGKHGVIKGKDWDIRQTFCLGCAILTTGVCWGLMHLDITGIIIIAVITSTGAFFVGWYQKAGLKIEQIIIKHFQSSMYKNQRRSYHTRNGYVDLMNSAYRALRNADMSDKKTAKMVENQQKREKAKKRVSKYKFIT